MVDEHRDMEGWGVYSIFKESGRLLYQHFRILRPFIFAFLLPLALLLFLEVIGIAWVLTWVADHAQPHHLGGIVGHHRHSGFHAFPVAFFKAPNPPDPVPVFVLQLLLLAYTLIFLITTISWLLVSLTSAAIAKAIHHIYSSSNNDNPTSHNDDNSSSQSQALTHSIFASLPHSLYRIIIISLCFFVVDIFAYFVLALPFYLLSGPQVEPYQTIHTWLWYLVFLFLDFWSLVSIQVVVLESYDGWAALQRSAKLVKAKGVTAMVLVAVYFVYFFVFKLGVAETVLIPAHSVLLYVAAVALAVVNSVFVAFWFVVVTVFYFVSKRKCGGGEGEEGRQPYQALDVAVEN